MPTLRIEHAVPDFTGWKKAFDSDPADRKGSGVRRYQVLQSVEDPNYVLIDLEFDSLDVAEKFLAKMRRVWSGEGQSVMRNPQARIVERLEANEVWRPLSPSMPERDEVEVIAAAAEAREAG